MPCNQPLSCFLTAILNRTQGLMNFCSCRYFLTLQQKMIKYFLLVVITFGAAFLYKSWGQSGTAAKNVETFQIKSTFLNDSRTIWVYLPLNYNKNKKYPVLYLFDGQNLFDNKTAYAGEWEVDETLNSLKAELIVVGLNHGNDKRLEELTPFVHPKYGGGKADTFLQFLLKEVIPEIKKRYSITTESTLTGIGGSSLGGLTAFYAAFKHQKTFGRALIFSPAFWYDQKVFEIPLEAEKKPKLYFMCGDSESETMVAEITDLLEILKKDVHYSTDELPFKIVAKGNHNEQLWRSQFKEAIENLFPEIIKKND